MTPLDRWNAALDAKGLTPSEKLALMEVANRDGGRGCFASIGKMMERTGLSRRSLQRSLRSLVSKGWVIQLTRFTDRPNRYRFSRIEVCHSDAPLRHADAGGAPPRRHRTGI